MWTTTALDLFAQQSTRGFLTQIRCLDEPVSFNISVNSTINEGYHARDVVEICGDSNTPKSTMLHHVIVAYLISKESEMMVGKCVYVFDHEYEFSAAQLFRILCEKLLAANPLINLTERKHRARNLLRRVVLYRCRDTFQWLATLNKLHFELLDTASTRTASTSDWLILMQFIDVAFMLVLNCVNSFDAIDKMVAKQVGKELALVDQPFIFLKQFIRHHSPIVFTTKTTPLTGKQVWDTTECMSPAWASQVTKRIHVRIAQHKGITADDGKKLPQLLETRSMVHGTVLILLYQVNPTILDEVVEEVHQTKPISTSAPTVPPTTHPDMTAATLWELPLQEH